MFGGMAGSPDCAGKRILGWKARPSRMGEERGRTVS